MGALPKRKISSHRARKRLRAWVLKKKRVATSKKSQQQEIERKNTQKA